MSRKSSLFLQLSNRPPNEQRCTPNATSHYSLYIELLKITNITHRWWQFCSTWRLFNPASCCLTFHTEPLALDLQTLSSSRCTVQSGTANNVTSTFLLVNKRRQAGRDLRATITFICDNWDRASVSCLSAGCEGPRAGESGR